MTDFRALCEELVEALDECQRLCGDQPESPLVWKARAALAEQPVGPTDEELERMWIEQYGYTGYSPAMSILEFKDAARAVLARWGQLAITPIPAAERWPEFSDCDPQERVWAWNPVLDHWKLSRINRSVHTHWLPANALPVPADD